MNELTRKVKQVLERYCEEFPEVNVDRDYYPFKLNEELGECIKAYLMYTDRGRQKGLSKEEIRYEFENELADVFGFLLLFADHEHVDLEEVLKRKWLSRLSD